MKHYSIILLFTIALISCKKDINTNTVISPTTVTRSFYIRAYDDSGNELTSVTSNVFIINFYQNNSIVYTVKTKNTGVNTNIININNFKDGGYIYEVKDSLNLFG